MMSSSYLIEQLAQQRVRDAHREVQHNGLVRAVEDARRRRRRRSDTERTHRSMTHLGARHQNAEAAS